MAVPAYPRKILVPTFNGKSVFIHLKGDEYQKFALSEDGYTLLNDSEGWWYATILEDGMVGKSSFRLTTKEDESIELKDFKTNCPKGILPQRTQIKRENSVVENESPSSNIPVIGKRHSLVILMQFKDLPFTKTKSDFDELFNGLGYNKNGAIGSVRDFYQFASQGQLDYISDIYGPFTSQYPMKYYGENTIYGGDSHPLELCIEAIKSLPSDFDYTPYDSNNDGFVDNVHIIFAGYGEESGGVSDAIWSHEYPRRINLKNEVGYSLNSYSCSPELKGNTGSDITNIGVVCHELGHALGAMDYYDTNYMNGGEYVGTGEWDIMANGSWNDEGCSPANFNPYVRSCVFGWNAQITLTPNQYVTMQKSEIGNAEQTIVYRIDTECDGDYFLLENRQKNSFDSALPGEGLMIYHVHPNIDRYNSTNTVNATHPQGFYPVCSSYSDPTNKKYGDINSTGCPYPGSSNVKSISSTTSPAMLAWDGSSAKVSLSDITMNYLDGSLTFVTGEDSIITPDKPDVPIDKNVVYKESFETNISNQFTVSSFVGKENWRVFRKGNFVVNAELIPEASDGTRIFMLYLGKENTINESEAIGPDIDVVAGDEYILSFDICSYCSFNNLSPKFDLFVEDEYGEYLVYTSNKIETKWVNVEIPLRFASNKFHYKLHGNLSSGGIFIDNIQLCKENVIESIKKTYNKKDAYIYKLNGVFVGKFSDYSIQLESGVYLIRKNSNVWKEYIP